MDNSLKGLILSAGVIITCVVIGLGFYISRESSNTGNNASSQIVEMTSQYESINSSLYDQKKVSGQEIVNLIKKNIEWMEISVITSAGTTTIYNYKIDPTGAITVFSDNNISTIQSVPSNLNYINPSGSFLGSLKKNANGVVVGIIFTQQ